MGHIVNRKAGAGANFSAQVATCYAALTAAIRSTGCSSTKTPGTTHCSVGHRIMVSVMHQDDYGGFPYATVPYTAAIQIAHVHIAASGSIIDGEIVTAGGRVRRTIDNLNIKRVGAIANGGAVPTGLVQTCTTVEGGWLPSAPIDVPLHGQTAGRVQSIAGVNLDCDIPGDRCPVSRRDAVDRWGTIDGETVAVSGRVRCTIDDLNIKRVGAIANGGAVPSSLVQTCTAVEGGWLPSAPIDVPLHGQAANRIFSIAGIDGNGDISGDRCPVSRRDAVDCRWGVDISDGEIIAVGGRVSRAVDDLNIEAVGAIANGGAVPTGLVQTCATVEGGWLPSTPIDVPLHGQATGHIFGIAGINFNGDIPGDRRPVSRRDAVDDRSFIHIIDGEIVAASSRISSAVDDLNIEAVGAIANSRTVPTGLVQACTAVESG